MIMHKDDVLQGLLGDPERASVMTKPPMGNFLIKLLYET